ncbi:Hypothetical Protein FCC1311_031432 [Hondaea fermentalgiana]|uniref:Uncharacterized protein n=1 Tax=Hondaea fermentalgiana TaxID=2315210 RepID=A0A2R5G7E5_9STRA|nr:Hypothetical Protein FCC1311_031432 [Hondaea fermentalgiana]|eukprot:GBG26920.1 Hypothetical Protein FCC1311_031432 [Hondaea fermentalgiana]
MLAAAATATSSRAARRALAPVLGWTVQEREIKQSAPIVKACVSVVLLFPTVWVIALLSTTVSFSCARESDSQASRQTPGFLTASVDEDTCWLRLLCAVLSMVFLLPFLHECVTIVLEVAKCETIPFLKGTTVYAKRSEVKDLLINCAVICALPVFLILVPLFPFYKVANRVFGVKLEFKIVGTILMLLPDFCLTVALFPLSFLVVASSESPGDIIVNIVAVQVFAQLDDIIVRMLVQHNASVGQALDAYCVGPFDEWVRVREREGTSAIKVVRERV